MWTDQETLVGLIELLTGEKVLPVVYIPQGQGQSVDELSGASSISDHEVYAIDPSGDLKAMVADPANPLLGEIATLSLGFPGMALADYSLLATLQVTKAGTRNDGRVYFNLADLQRTLKYYIWTNGGPSAWIPGAATPPAPLGVAFAENGHPISDSNPRYLQGNPIELALVAYQNELGLGQPTGTDPFTGLPLPWQIYMPGNDATLINPNAFLDVPALLALRDRQFSGDWMEFVLKAQETAKSWIETQILRPLGLYTVVLSTGMLSFKTMKHPPSVTPLSWNDNSIKGIPEIDRWDVLNVVQARMNTEDSQPSTAARTYKAEITFKDDVSIAQFKQELVHQVELTGLRTRRGGLGRAFILSDRIFRRHGYGTPVYSVTVQLRNLGTELAEFVYLTHALVPDLKAKGVRGITNVLCEVVDRQPNYTDAELSYKLLDTRFVQPSTAYQIAPDATPDWASASAGQKTTLLFITGDDGKMSDGAVGNTIF